MKLCGFSNLFAYFYDSLKTNLAGYTLQCRRNKTFQILIIIIKKITENSIQNQALVI